MILDKADGLRIILFIFARTLLGWYRLQGFDYLETLKGKLQEQMIEKDWKCTHIMINFPCEESV